MRKIDRVTLAVTTALCTAAAAMAGETTSYSYDVHGRLVKAARSGTVNDNVSASYSYDKADNRLNVTVVSSNPPPPAPPPPPPPPPGPPPPPPPPANNPPTPVGDSGAQGRCTTGTYIVTTNDTDPDGDYPLSLVSVTGVGFSVLSSTILQFTSTAGTGAKVGTYIVQDSRGATATATLTVNVSGGVCE